MKSQTLPIKRRPVSQGMFRRLSAVTQSRRRQRVSASATGEDMEFDDGGSRVSWALTIVFLIHVVALCLIFIHHHFLSGRPAEGTASAKAPVEVAAAPAVEPDAAHVLDSQITAAPEPHFVKQGETYASIARDKGVMEADLRQLNGQAALRKGLALKIPNKKVKVGLPATQMTVVAPVINEIDEAEPAVAPVVAPRADEGLVPAIDVRDAPRAVAAVPTGASAAGAGASTHVVKPGESVWGIAKRYGVTQEKLMEANGIKDTKKLFAGMKLAIPE